jgi:hypothetical protein
MSIKTQLINARAKSGVLEPGTTMIREITLNGSKMTPQLPAPEKEITPEVELDEEQVTAAPARRIPLPQGVKTPVGALLKCVPGGWRKMFEMFAQLDLGPDDPRVRLILAWNTLSPKERAATTPEKLCEMISISPGRLIGLLSETAYELEQSTSVLERAIHHQELVRKSVSFAKRRDGFKDREMLFKSSGFLPSPHGSTQNVNVSTIAAARAEATTPRDLSLESMEEDTIELTSIIRDDPQDSPAGFVRNRQ